MGNSSYDSNARFTRSVNVGYTTKSVNEIFTQNVERKIHEQMNPKNVLFRESCDSKEHPNTVPIQFYLDVTGSMGHIPHEMIKNGLPTLIGNLIQNGIPDAALLFGAIGDHETDNFPLQIAQFESGDAELDMWLTRVYLEGNGGGNGGESYLLAWYFAAFHTKTDAFEKRGKKGFVFTIGDEPCLKNLPVSAIKALMETSAVGQANYTAAELLAAAQEKNHVYHIHLDHGGRICDSMWKELLGENLIVIKDVSTIPRVMSDIIISKSEVIIPPAENKKDDTTKQENLL